MTTAKSNLIKSLVPSSIQLAFLILAVVAAFFIGKLSTEVSFYEKQMAGNNQLAQAPENAPQEEPYQPIDPAKFTAPDNSDYVMGNPEAKIAIIEYSDFDCPFCVSFHETAKQIVEESNGSVKWIYRHFPLIQLHPDAMKKAIASECAVLQGDKETFWDFVDEIFATYTGNTLGDEEYTAIAGKLGIDAQSFLNCIAEEETKGLVDSDIASAEKVGVQGTPGNYIANLENNVIIPLRGAEPLDNVRNVLKMVQEQK